MHVQVRVPLLDSWNRIEDLDELIDTGVPNSLFEATVERFTHREVKIEHRIIALHALALPDLHNIPIK